MRLHGFLHVVAAILLTGCATGKITKVRNSLDAGELPRGTLIYVKQFDSSTTVFKGNINDVESEKKRLPTIIQTELISYLANNGYTAKEFDKSVSPGAVVVEGKITQVISGSAAARFWVGMGAGKSSVKADVKIYRPGTPIPTIVDAEFLGTSGGTGGIYAYQDWLGANAKDLAIKIGKYIIDGNSTHK